MNMVDIKLGNSYLHSEIMELLTPENGFKFYTEGRVVKFINDQEGIRYGFVHYCSVNTNKMENDSVITCIMIVNHE